MIPLDTSAVYLAIGFAGLGLHKWREGSRARAASARKHVLSIFAPALFGRGRQRASLTGYGRLSSGRAGSPTAERSRPRHGGKPKTRRA